MVRREILRQVSHKKPPKHADFIKGKQVKNEAILKSRRSSAQAHAKRKEFGWNGAKKTHCPWGHPYTEENTRYFVQPHGGWARSCKACVRERQRKSLAAKRSA